MGYPAAGPFSVRITAPSLTDSARSPFDLRVWLVAVVGMPEGPSHLADGRRSRVIGTGVPLDLVLRLIWRPYGG